MKIPVKTESDVELLRSELLAVGLEMQDRFSAEPVYATTGKGFLKSAGVEELLRIKSSRRANRRES